MRVCVTMNTGVTFEGEAEVGGIVPFGTLGAVRLYSDGSARPENDPNYVGGKWDMVLEPGAPVVATITRYRIPQRTGRFAWYYGYDVVLKGKTHAMGRTPLASIRSWAKRNGATQIVETWKS